ncbi:unnamed protein product [Ascophyllum nodosum]
MARLTLAYLAALRAVSVDAGIGHIAFARGPLATASSRPPRGLTTRSSCTSVGLSARAWTSTPRFSVASAPLGRVSEGTISSQMAGAGAGAGEGVPQPGDGEVPEGKGVADDTVPIGNNEDHFVSAVAGNGQVVARAMTARNLVQDALVRQDLRPLAADALGRVMVCTMLMAGGLKDRETFQLTFSGSGPLGGVVAISDGEGGVRGYVNNGQAKQVELPLKENGNQDVAAGIGKGLLKVVRNHPDYERPYTGITALKSGEVAYDAAVYLADSEQKSCAIAAGCFVTGALVRQAGGYMLETLPDASEETEKTVVNNIAKLLNRAEDPSELLGRGLTPLGIVETLLDGLGGVGALTYKRPAFLCHCSDQRVYQALRLLDKREIQELIKTGDSVEVKCEFCGKEYRLTADDVIKELELTPPEES